MKKYSVIIPVYNVENYLEECILSVIMQTYSNIEVILVDDGSTDRSGTICDSWSLKDERIKVIHKHNGGLSSARNAGIKVAEGDYLLFLDSDDYFANVEIIKQLDNNIQSDVVVFNYLKVWPDGRCILYYPSSIGRQDGLTSEDTICKNLWATTACNKAIRRDIIYKNNLFFVEGITNEDLDWCVRLAIAMSTCSYFGAAPLFCYRQNRIGSITTEQSLDQFNCQVSNFICCIQIVNESNSKYLYAFIAYQYCVLLLNFAIKQSFDIDQYKKIIQYKWILKYGLNKKCKAIYISTRILGMRNTMRLLRLYNTLIR